MKNIIISIWKERLLLQRDATGVVMMFVLPLLLVIVISLLQHKSFQDLKEQSIPIVIIDNDNDLLSEEFIKGMGKSSIFDLTIVEPNDSVSLDEIKEQVASGTYQIGVYIPPNTTKTIKNRAVNLVQQQIPGSVQSGTAVINQQATLELFFDPLTKQSFKDIVRSNVMQFSASTETRIIFEAYTKFIDAITNQKSDLKFPEKSAINFDEVFVSEHTAGIIPNAIQHNVPAWILFGMFLICIPIAGNIIKERSEGCLARLKTIPINYLEIMVAKSIVFVAICLLQALVIILVGIYIMPIIGLPKLQVNDNQIALFMISLASASAASAYGIAIGSIASTQIQASVFGSVSTVILAAIGGIWIPIVIMSPVMRKISEMSPMNWGIQGYYKVFLRGANTIEILPEIGKLFLFAFICLLLGLTFRKYNKSV